MSRPYFDSNDNTPLTQEKQCNTMSPYSFIGIFKSTRSLIESFIRFYLSKLQTMEDSQATLYDQLPGPSTIPSQKILKSKSHFARSKRPNRNQITTLMTMKENSAYFIGVIGTIFVIVVLVFLLFPTSSSSSYSCPGANYTREKACAALTDSFYLGKEFESWTKIGIDSKYHKGLLKLSSISGVQTRYFSNSIQLTGIVRSTDGSNENGVISQLPGSDSCSSSK